MRVYEKNGYKYLSVTSIVDLMYPFDNEQFKQWATSKNLVADEINKKSVLLGERYHAYFENKFYGISDWADVVEDDKDRGYQEAVNDFYNQGWEILDSEQEVFCRKWKYAGRFDCIVRNRKLGIEKALGDVKTWGAWSGKLYKRDSNKIKKVTVQLNMYEYAIKEKLPKVCIIPQKDGKCIIENIKDDTSFLVWLEEHKQEIIKLINQYNGDIRNNTCDYHVSN